MTGPVPTVVADILSVKGSLVRVTDTTAPVREAVRTMVNANVGALVVLEEGTIVGMLTERDYLRRIVLHPHLNRDTPVGQVMSTPVVTVSPDTTLEDCLALMTQRRIRHTPVLANDTLVGIVSIGDLVKAQVTRHEAQLRYLHEYITAR